jgi:hypothetical protein
MTREAALELESIARKKVVGTPAAVQGIRVKEPGYAAPGTPEQDRYTVCVLGHDGLPRDVDTEEEIDAFIARQEAVAGKN